MRFMVVAAGLTLTVVCRADGASSRQRPAARPVDAVAAILDAFHTHPIVALDEEHADERSHAFRLTLIRDPRLPFVVNDVVVEFGNALHQDVMDRFVAGDRVADETLKKIWQDTTQAHTIWDRPIYQDFFREVRAVKCGPAVRPQAAGPPRGSADRLDDDIDAGGPAERVRRTRRSSRWCCP